VDTIDNPFNNTFAYIFTYLDSNFNANTYLYTN
jgi:hypothetical protein